MDTVVSDSVLPEAAADSSKLAQRYYQKFYARCFWSCSPRFKVETREDAEWVADGLRENGGRDGWNAAREIVSCLQGMSLSANGATA